MHHDQIKIILFNANSLASKIEEFEFYLHENNPDIVFVNELKMSQEEANYSLHFHNYACVEKVRNKHGGGVCILIKKNIEHTMLNEFDHLNIELVAIQIKNKYNKKPLILATYYNPPYNQKRPILLNEEIFRLLSNKKTPCGKNIPFVIAGDLNANTTTIGCLYQNENGNILENVMSDNNLVLINDHSPTRCNNNILDLIICSPELAHNFSCFKADEFSGLHSDHYPVLATLDFSPFNITPTAKEPRLNINKTDWDSFKRDLSVLEVDHNLDCLTLNKIITTAIKISAENNTPKIPNKIYKFSLPADIIEIIKKKRKARRNFKKTNKIEYKQEYNTLTSLTRKKIFEYRNENWNNFIKKTGPNLHSSRPFWAKVNKFRTKKKGSTIPELSHNEKTYTSDQEKCNLFGSILSDTFSIDLNEAFDKVFEESVLKCLTEKDKKRKEKPDFVDFSLNELKTAIKKLNKDSAMGPDKIHNQHLINLPAQMQQHILHLFNKCAREDQYPDDWKVARISMIPKKDNNRSDPANYRPISVTSCLGKLYERLFTSRLCKFLEDNRILSNVQSGFRRHRSTSDNILFLTQKISESFNRKKNVVAIFFDISKAFDKVWHEGLIYKLYKCNIPLYIIEWVKTFLYNRKFFVHLNNTSSNMFDIKAGVPQGAVVSPILFNIFINDIPKKNNPNQSYSTLYADDLVTFFIYKKKSNAQEKHINNYLKELEMWLFKYKMKICAKKCNYTIFSQNKKQYSSFNFDLKIFNENIPNQKNPKFLGVTFDPHLCFNTHIASVIKNSFNRLNIIKIISHKSWKLSSDTLFTVYKALVSSLFNYSFFCANLISSELLRKLQVIQNTAVRSIFKLPPDTSSTDLKEIAKAFNLAPVHERLFELNKNYIKKSLEFSNPLIVQLINEFDRGFGGGRQIVKPTPLCASRTVVEIFFGGMEILD